MIVVGPQDVGRRVRIRLMGKPDEIGEIVDHEGCGRCGHPCCKVQWGNSTCYTYTSRLSWADENGQADLL